MEYLLKCDYCGDRVEELCCVDTGKAQAFYCQHCLDIHDEQQYNKETEEK